MAKAVIFHSALGLRPAIGALAERLRREGHDVATPDVFEGEVFNDLELGAAKRDAIGIQEILARAFRAVADLPEDLIYIGFSMGAAAAQCLAAGRPGACGAVLFHGALPLEATGQPEWPPSVPMQFHGMKNDPWIVPSIVEGLGARVPLFEAWWYEGHGHLFTDSGASDFDAGATEAAYERMRAFLVNPPSPSTSRVGQLER